MSLRLGLLSVGFCQHVFGFSNPTWRVLLGVWLVSIVTSHYRWPFPANRVTSIQNEKITAWNLLLFEGYGCEIKNVQRIKLESSPSSFSWVLISRHNQIVFVWNIRYLFFVNVREILDPQEFLRFFAFKFFQDQIEFKCWFFDKIKHFLEKLCKTVFTFLKSLLIFATVKFHYITY